MAENYATINTLLDGGKPPPPLLPELRMFVVRRLDPQGRFDESGPGTFVRINEILVTAHCAEYGQGGVLILMAYVVDDTLGEVVQRTVRAFHSWLDVEIVPTPAKSTLAH